MCGISGIIHLDSKPVQEEEIRIMMQRMKHRGPDDEGLYIEPRIGLGFVRLSIIDLSSAGRQPMFSIDNTINVLHGECLSNSNSTIGDGRYVIVYNGEIFNYIELRAELIALGYSFATNTDTEVLLTAFIEWGEKCLHMLNGMWAFVIYDRLSGKVFASRDRYGIKPFYYCISDNAFIFASEIPPILAILKNKPNPNNQVIFDYLVFNRTDQTENTFFKGINKLQHGHQLILDLNMAAFENAITITKWYDLRKELLHKSVVNSPEEFKELFADSIRLRLRSDVPLGVCLSGGLDSSSIVSILLKEFNKINLNTFSAIYGKGKYGDETEFINEFNSRLKNMFYSKPNADSLYDDLISFIKAHGEPIPSTSPYAQFKVMELAGKEVKVTLDGQGADEMLAGYPYFFGYFYKDLLRNGRFLDLVSEIYHYLKIHKSLYGIKIFGFLLFPESVRTWLRIREKGYLRKDFQKKLSQSSSIAGTLYGSASLHESLIDHFEYKLEHLLKWEDRNSMWFSLEARVPFLDHRLVEATLSLNGKSYINRGMTKSILRESIKGIVPEKIRMRKDKIGFDTPQDEWLREPQFKELVNEILAPGSFITTEFIDANIALKKYNKHLNGKINISKEIWKWIHLELWYQEFCS